MKLEALPTLLMTRRLQSYVSQTRTTLDSVRVEAVTGLAADRAEKVSGEIGHLRKLEKLLDDGEQRLTAIANFNADASVVQLSLEQTRETLSKLQFDVEGAVALKNEKGLQAAAATARAELEALFGRLNATHAGRYLFSGAKTDTAPLGDLDTLLEDVQARLVGSNPSTIESAMDLYFNEETGIFQTSFYSGSTTAYAPSREVDEHSRLGIEIKAIDKPIRDTIRALAVIALAADGIADEELRHGVLDNNAKLAGGAAHQLIVEQTKLGARQGVAAQLEARHNGVATTLQTQLRELLAVDQYEAATRMNDLETQLEAAYLTTQRIQQLTLLNYMR